MATLSCSSSHLILHRFILRRPTFSFHQSSLLSQVKQSFHHLKLTATPPSPSTRSFSFTPSRLCATSQQLANDVALLDNPPTESVSETNAASAAEGLKNLNLVRSKTPPPSLTIKEKKELASYAHSLGKKLKSQQVGKSGVTDTVVTALIETLEANELLKLKVRGTCPSELDEVMKLLEECTGSVVVSQIGRTLILYRPSLTKLKEEEKKKQARLAYAMKQQMSRQSPQSRRQTPRQEQEPRQFGRGRRGSSRV